jgi:uncharacterized protein
MSKIDPRLLDMLVCPVSKVALTPLSSTELGVLNQNIQAGSVLSVDGHMLKGTIAGALQTIDGKVIYPIRDGIMQLLPEEGIGTAQFSDWPRR